jgi:hypothetical protein
MLQLYRTMFTPTKELLQQQQTICPAASHITLFKEWRELADSQLLEVQEAIEMNHEEREIMNGVQDLFIEGLHLFLQKATNCTWRQKTKEEKKQQILTLLQTPQTEQRTHAWYQQTQYVLTASEFSNLYGSERQYASLVMSKSGTLLQEQNTNYRLACCTTELSALDWGIRFEPVIKQVLESKWSIQIVDSGRLLHPHDPKLAASPDGFIMEGDAKQVGRLIEIKCPLSRKIGQGIPFDYWCQMQIQMEVTDIDECVYIEAKLISPHARQHEYSRPETPFAEGFLWLLTKDTAMRYAYTEVERETLLADGYELLETVPWAIESYFTEVVSREKAWYEGTKQLREDFWGNVQKAKEGTFKLPPPFVKKVKVQTCLIDDSSPT